MNVITTQEAEAAINSWALRFKQVIDEAEALGDFATDTYTEENRANGGLALGMNAEGGLVPWTVEDLAAVNASYDIPRQVAAWARSPGANGKPSVIRRVHGLIRTLGR
jgi:hypothetical protein